jgi:Fic family protein
MDFDRKKPFNELPDLPPVIDLEDTDILKLCIKANKVLAELKGYCHILPDPNLLINTIILQESKDSSAIENIVTTQDELYKAVMNSEDIIKNQNAKEVILYREALYLGLELLKRRGLTINSLIKIMQKLKNTNEEIRKTTGTRLMNPQTSEIFYTPPEGEYIIREKLAALEKFIHSKDEIDPLVKMALIHYQFEAIHPFSDGNGRTGRILNVLFLVHENLLNIPVLYLSSYIIKNKSKYYLLLREITESKEWTEWIKFMLNAVHDTAEYTLKKISGILKLKQEVTNQFGDSYNRDLLDLIFKYPYVKINILERNNIAKRETASKYLKSLATDGVLTQHKVGKELYFINHRLMKLLIS